ncbi:hypothetical protein [Streptacidiphilus sp. PAMC 29251]
MRPDRCGGQVPAAFPLLALVLGAWVLWGSLIGPTDVLLALALYTFTGLGVTVGFHRCTAPAAEVCGCYGRRVIRAVPGRGRARTAVDSTRRHTGPARLLAVLAVLVGMFLMHGAPTTAMGDCHGSMSLTLPGTHPMAATAPLVVNPAAQAQRPSDAATGAQGTSCVSTLTRDHVTLPAAPLMAFAVLAALTVLIGTGRLGSGPAARRRGPPPAGGRQLLLRVCIDRT